MAKYEHKTNQRVTQLFEDLEMFKEFCQEYGFVYNEAHLYDTQSFPFRQFLRMVDKKTVRNMWAEDAARYEQMQKRIAQY